MSPTKSSKGKGKARSTDTSDPDNTAGAGRKRKESARAREGRENAAEVSAMHACKRLAQKERREERRLERLEELLVEQEGETEREAQYREFALMMQAQNDEMAIRISRIKADRAKRQQAISENSTLGSSGSASRPSGGAHGCGDSSTVDRHATTSAAPVPAPAPVPVPAPGSIGPPDKLSEVTMSQIRQHLGLAKDTTRWFEIRAHVRDFMAMAALNLDEPWKHQNKTRLGNLYESILQRIPEFARFLNNWAAEIIVRDVFNHCRTFRNSKKPGWKGKRKRQGSKKDAENPCNTGSESEHTHLSPAPRSRATTPQSGEDAGLREPAPTAHGLASGNERVAASRVSTPDASRLSRAPTQSPSPAPKKLRANRRKEAVEDTDEDDEDAQDPGVDIEMSNPTPRRSERHSAALAAAAAAAEDDQQAATRERA
ncbi:hypothetical protein RhiJN_19954 [Ceratobasidium sp. AG-Ba]|nr:hypothetical protein RhiJN_19954 [Ceratobasidium sp. AG-Ba]